MQVRSVILVVTTGGAGRFIDVVYDLGRTPIVVNPQKAELAMRAFKREFDQDITLAVLHGMCVDDANELAEKLKKICRNMQIVSMSNEVGESTREADSLCDVLIPSSRIDLQNTLGNLCSSK